MCEEYGYIFGADEEIRLKPIIVAYIVAELQKFSLLETEYDYKGQAYEEIVGANSRGERGEFFTPRNLCALAVQIAIKLCGEGKIHQLRVLDPACGTGGFLKTYVYSLYRHLLKQETAKTSDLSKAESRARDRTKSACDRNLYGMDFNPVLVRAAQMNLVMHGDGSSNIYHENALLSCGEWGNEVRLKVKDGAFDLIITNPPFGEDLSVDDPHVLGQYTVTNFESSGPRQSLPPQCLFVERCHRLLKPGGLLVLVTPDNIVSNPSHRYMRHWMLRAFRLIASISLPGEMFQPWTGTRTTLLIMKKRRQIAGSFEEIRTLDAACSVFMAIPKRIGHDQRGNPIYLRDEEGDVVLREETRKTFVRSSTSTWEQEEVTIRVPLRDDDLPRVYSEFTGWLQDNGVAI